MRLLLFSNSTNAGEEYLAYTLPYINEFLKGQKTQAVFIPYAGISVGFDTYTSMVADKLLKAGVSLVSLHQVENKRESIQAADLIITGGGNTFCLLKTLQDEDLLGVIREKVRGGTPYIGWSAGSNLACPTVRTTNDMPIVEPAGFAALNLIPFQINPHYTDFKQEGHAGETREMRIQEFLLMNRSTWVAGLREHSLLHLEENSIMLKGTRSCRLFRYGDEAREINPGEDISLLLQ